MSDIDTKKIFELKQELARLLAERPEYKPFQEKIDEIIRNAGSHHNACVLLTQMMRDNMRQLKEHLDMLQIEMLKYAKALKEKEDAK